MPEALTQEEIDSLLSSVGNGEIQKPAEKTLVRTNSRLISSENRNFKTYNFRRPDKFSKDHLRALQGIHETFARTFSLALSSYLRIPIQMEVLSVDQLTYDEFVRSMPSPITVNVIEMSPLPGQCLMGYSYEITTAMIDRMLGGPGAAQVHPRQLTDIEQSLLKRIFDKSLFFLQDAWKSALDVKISLTAVEDSYTLIQVASPGEMVAMVTFEVVFGKESSLMSFCIPYPTLENVMGSLSSQHIFQQQRDAQPVEDRENLMEKLGLATLPIDVVISGTDMNVKDLLELDVGDVFQLDGRVTDELIIKVSGRPKFKGFPGTIGRKLGVYVTEPIENEETIEGYGL